MAIFLFTALTLSCAPSEQEIQAEFDEFVSNNQACKEDNDCTLIQPGCPLGCSIPVATNAADNGTRLAQDLIEDYESAGRGCDYDCALVCGAACESKRCVAVEPTDNACP